MTSRYFMHARQAVILAAILAALVIPAVALADSGSPAPDWFERYAAAHPYGQSSIQNIDGRSADTLDAVATSSSSRPAPDWFERYAAAHPYGAANSGTIDGRSADTLDVAQKAQQASLIPEDGRSADTRDAASAPRPVVLSQPSGFDWRDASIGAGFSVGVFVLLGVAAMLWLRYHARHGIHAT